MKKINISNLNLKNVINKENIWLIVIDVFFYSFITFGFLLTALFSRRFDIDPVTSSIVWTIIFIPTLILKVRKDLLYKENRRLK